MIATRKQIDRKAIVMAIESAAALYKQHLVGYTFMYVFDDRYIEVIYKTENFKHLTGVDSSLSARAFYKNAVSHRLQATQIYFSARHPYRLCKRKLAHLAEIPLLAGNESFMLEEITTATRAYKFGNTNLQFTLCMNKEFTADGQPKGNCYVVESIRDEDCFARSKNVYEITHIYRRRNDAKLYDTELYSSPNAVLPVAVQCLLKLD